MNRKWQLAYGVVFPRSSMLEPRSPPRSGPVTLAFPGLNAEPERAHRGPDPERGRSPAIVCRRRTSPRRVLESGARLLAVGWATLLAGIGCAAPHAGAPHPQAHYQTTFPDQDFSEELNSLWNSVKRVMVNGMYQTHVFAELDAPTDTDPFNDEVLSRASRTSSQYRGRAATAVVLSVRGRTALLLTAKHSVHFPDTVVQHFRDGRSEAVDGGAPRRIRSIAFLTDRTNLIRMGESLEQFQVLALDPDHDLALIGARLPSPEDRDVVSPLPFPAGHSSHLSWGSFVYTAGFPSGHSMITRGIVSEPTRGSDRRFLTDGMWNEGMSGGPVLAVRGGGGGLEWVGMARAAGGTVEYRLAAPEEVEETHDPWRPYTGPIFIQEMQRIQYGISHSVPIGPIRRFLAAHRSELEVMGFRVPQL